MNAEVISAEVFPDVPFTLNETKVDTRTIADLHTKGYTGIAPDLMKDILYLEQLAVSTSQRIDDLKPIELLAPIGRGDKRAINKLFFTLVEDRKAVLGKLDSETFARIQRAMFDAAEKRRQSDIDSVEYSLRESERGVKSRVDALNASLKAYNDRHETLRRLQGLTPESCVGAFQEILNNPFFQFERFAFNKAYFVTSNAVIMHYKHPALGMDHSLNFGRLRFTLDVVACTLKASKCENNLVSRRGYYHTYISAEGDICFGTHADTVYRWLGLRDFGKVFEVLAALLVTYDSGSTPYYGFDSFVHEEANGSSHRETPATCADCGNVEESCSCPWCDHCGMKGHSTENCTATCQECEKPKDKCHCNENYCGDCDHYQSDCDCSEEECHNCSNEH